MRGGRHEGRCLSRALAPRSGGYFAISPMADTPIFAEREKPMIAMPMPPGESASLRDDVVRRAARKGLDVVDQLVGERLHGFAARPRDMRRDDEVGQPQFEEGIALARRLCREHVEAGAAKRPMLQRLRQRLLVDEAAARRVDE